MDDWSVEYIIQLDAEKKPENKQIRLLLTSFL